MGNDEEDNGLNEKSIDRVRPTTNKKKEYDRERNNVKNEMTCAK